jgi:uncharacterized surface protein with fasciclin (FAS1) repeats
MGKLLSNGHNIEEGPADPEISEFAQLLVDARLLDERFRDAITREVIPNLKFLAANKYWTAFIPTNEAMAKARAEGIIPEEYPPASDRDAREAIDNFIKYHFIQGSVVFDDGMKSGAFDTHYSYRDAEDNTKIVNEKVMVINSPENMAVEDISGQVVPIDHADANKLVRKGVVHKINTVLNYQK